MTAIINQQSAEFGPEQDPHFVDYLAQPFMLGEHTPAADTQDIADQPHDLSVDEKLALLSRMIPLMRDPFESKVEMRTPSDANAEIRALKLEFSNPPKETPAQAESEKPTHDHSEIFSQF